MKILVLFTISSLLIPDAYALSQKSQCEDALIEAEGRVKKQYQNNTVQPDSSSGTKTASSNSGGGAGDAISNALQQVAQADQQRAQLESQSVERKAQLEAQSLEKYQQLKDERLAKTTEIEDKEHELKRSYYQRRQEAIDINFQAKVEETEVKKACEKSADEQHLALITSLNAKAAAEQFVADRISKVKGVRARVASRKRVFYSRCWNKESTRDTLRNIRGKRDAKLKAMQVAAEEMESDLEYNRSKLPKILSNLSDKERTIAQQKELQKDSFAKQKQLQEDSIAQQKKMAMIGALTSVFTSSSSAASGDQAARSFNSGDQIIKDLESIKNSCRGDDKTVHPIAVDYVRFFDEVKEQCNRECVRSSGQESLDRKSGQSTRT